MEGDPLFREVQRFRQPWLWTLLGGVALLMTVLGSISWGGLVVVGAIAVPLYSLRLQTEVRVDGIYIKMWPLHRSFRRISWTEIERYESKQYRSLREFGGWGIRWTPGKIAYNVSGNQGVWIERTNERAILVGSQHAEEFVRAIDEAVRLLPHRLSLTITRDCELKLRLQRVLNASSLCDTRFSQLRMIPAVIRTHK